MQFSARRSFSPVLLLLCSFQAWSLDLEDLSVDEGSLLLTRGAQGISVTPDSQRIGVEDQDVAATGRESRGEIAFRTARGLEGTLSLGPETVVRLEVSRKGPKSTVLTTLLRGSMSLWVPALSEGESFLVRAGATSLRAQESRFEVVEAPTGEVLVRPIEGQVECRGESSSLEANPGRAVQGAGFGSGGLEGIEALGDDAVVSQTWANLKATPESTEAYRAFRFYAGQYAGRIDGLRQAWDRMQREGLGTRLLWDSQDAMGNVSPAQILARERKTLLGPTYALLRAEKSLEWAWYRLQDLRPWVGGTEVEAFYQRFNRDREFVQWTLKETRTIMKQYVARNDGDSPFLTLEE